jgi:hypothetical protein
MPPPPANVPQDEDLLGRIAMRFRRAASQAERKKLAQEYAEVVERLIQGGCWQEAPPPEDQLPHDYMPSAFYSFWTQ